MVDEPEVELGIDGLTDTVEIGRGGNAVVYRAFQPAFERFVAVKLFGDLAIDEPAPAKFEDECRAIGRISGRANILTVYDAGITTSRRPYLVMAYMARGSLENRLRRHGPLPWSEAFGIGVKLAKALQIAHDAGVLHRDVKPDNVLISDDSEPLLADFGVALLSDVGRHPGRRPSFTPAHVAPEVLAGQPATAKVDIYSLASTLFALVVGHPAFVEGTDDTVRLVMRRVAEEPVPDLLRTRHVPERACRVIEAAMAKNPADRPPSAAAFGAELEAVQDEMARKKKAQRRKVVTRGSRKGPVLVVASIALVALLIVLVLRTINSKRLSDPVPSGTAPPGLIAFTVGSHKSSETGVWIVAPDGTHRRVKTVIPNCPREVVGARLRRDGRAMVFSPLNCGLWTVNLDGTGLKAVDPHGGCWSGCDWSPDGRSIVYETPGNDDQSTNLVLTAADRSASTQIGLGEAPEWSPDGKVIAFDAPVSSPLGYNIELFEVASGTTRYVVSTSQPAGVRAVTPSFDPRGTRLVVKVNNVGFKIIDLRSGTVDGHTIDVGLGAIVRVCTAAGDKDNHPSWSPDGKSIAYTTGDDQIAICDILSGIVRTLPKIGDRDQLPSWG